MPKRTHHSLPWQKARKTLPCSEWDFRNLAQEEALPCLLYECGRSADSFVKRVQDWRQENPGAFRAATDCLQQANRPATGCQGSAAPAPLSETLAAAGVKVLAKPWEVDIVAQFGQGFRFCLEQIVFGSPNKPAYPSGLGCNDRRAAFYYFPPFPETPWQDLPPLMRNVAACLFWFDPRLQPVALAGGGAPVSQGVKAVAKTQRLIDSTRRATAHDDRQPMDALALSQIGQQQIADHLFAPPLVERPNFGALPLSVSLDKLPERAWAGGTCRERVQLTLNWAHSNEELVKAFRDWLNKPNRRPHKPLEHWKLTAPREHLKKLGAMRVLRSGLSAYAAADNYPTLYSHPDMFFKATAKAEALIGRLFPSAGTTDL
jgi:hypothetical protein